MKVDQHRGNFPSPSTFANRHINAGAVAICVSSLVLGIGLTGCQQQYTVEQRGDMALRTERVVHPQDVEKLVLIADEDRFRYNIYGELSDISYYTRTEVTRSANPLVGVLAVGLSPLSLLLQGPERTADGLKTAVAGKDVNVQVKTENPIQEVKRLGKKDNWVADAAGAGFELRAADGSGSLERSGALDASGRLPITTSDLLRGYAQEQGRFPETLRWTVKITQTYVGSQQETPEKDTNPLSRFLSSVKKPDAPAAPREIEQQREFEREVDSNTVRTLAQKVVFEASDASLAAAYVKRYRDGYTELLQLDPALESRGHAGYVAAIDTAQRRRGDLDPQIANALLQRYRNRLEARLFSEITERRNFALLPVYKTYIVDARVTPNRYTELTGRQDRHQYEQLVANARQQNNPGLLKAYAKANTGRQYARDAEAEYRKLSERVRTHSFGTLNKVKIYEQADIQSRVLREDPIDTEYVLTRHEGEFVLVEYEFDRFGYVFRAFVD